MTRKRQETIEKTWGMVVFLFFECLSSVGHPLRAKWYINLPVGRVYGRNVLEIYVFPDKSPVFKEPNYCQAQFQLASQVTS